MMSLGQNQGGKAIEQVVFSIKHAGWKLVIDDNAWDLVNPVGLRFDPDSSKPNQP